MGISFLRSGEFLSNFNTILLLLLDPRIHIFSLFIVSHRSWMFFYAFSSSAYSNSSNLSSNFDDLSYPMICWWGFPHSLFFSLLSLFFLVFQVLKIFSLLNSTFIFCTFLFHLVLYSLLSLSLLWLYILIIIFLSKVSLSFYSHWRTYKNSNFYRSSVALLCFLMFLVFLYWDFYIRIRAFFFCFFHSCSLSQHVFSVQERLGSSEFAALFFSARLVIGTLGLVVVLHWR